MGKKDSKKVVDVPAASPERAAFGPGSPLASLTGAAGTPAEKLAAAPRPEALAVDSNDGVFTANQASCPPKRAERLGSIAWMQSLEEEGLPSAGIGTPPEADAAPI